MANPIEIAAVSSSTACQLAPESVPRLQKVIERACGSRAMYERKPTPLKNNAFTAIPMSKSEVVDSLLAVAVWAIRKTNAVASAPPKHAAIGKDQPPA